MGKTKTKHSWCTLKEITGVHQDLLRLELITWILVWQDQERAKLIRCILLLIVAELSYIVGGFKIICNIYYININ